MLTKMKARVRAWVIALTEKMNHWSERIEAKNKATRETELDPRTLAMEAQQKIALKYQRRAAEASMRGWVWGALIAFGHVALLVLIMKAVLTWTGVIEPRPATTPIAAEACTIYEVPPISTREEFY